MEKKIAVYCPTPEIFELVVSKIDWPYGSIWLCYQKRTVVDISLKQYCHKEYYENKKEEYNILTYSEWIGEDENVLIFN